MISLVQFLNKLLTKNVINGHYLMLFQMQLSKNQFDPGKTLLTVQARILICM